MSIHKKLNRGMDIPLKGSPAAHVDDQLFVSQKVGIKPTDFEGFGRIKVLAQLGTRILAGEPLFASKNDLRMHVTAPVSGEVVDLIRGDKRKPLYFELKADQNIEYKDFGRKSTSDIQNLKKEEALETMLEAGVWPQILQRPYGVVAKPEDTPKAIFISGFDTSPLAPDYNILFKNQDNFFQAGINILSKFTSGIIHVNINSNLEIPSVFSHVEGVQINKFSGPHPAGCVGVQIHHLDPINKGDIVWTINPYGVIQIGKLFLEGKYDASKIVALTGSEVSAPQYYKTVMGVQASALIEGKLKNDHVRVISGNPLTGEKIGADGFLSFYHHQFSVLPEGDQYEFFGWIKPQFNKFSFHRAFGLISFVNTKKERVLTTNMNGEQRAFVQTGVFEKVTPMDLYPEFLFKAILANDYDAMEQLGILEVVEEDLALCEFIDVSKNPIQKIIRDGINLMNEA